MANRLVASVVAVLLAIGAIYYQNLLDTFYPSPNLKVVDSLRDVTYLGSLSPAGVEHFQNIFYAEAPTGPRRFAAPAPTKPEKGSLIDATHSSAWCPQGTGDILPFTSVVANISEDCLSLRIARPAGTQKIAKLPVVVWIHGGGHALGSASDILYEPDGLVKLAAVDGLPLVYVGINYRLGLFGFATSDALIATKDTNAGLRDQRTALEWVRDNIESFGGDPNRVTVIGQSVGASDIGLQLTAFGGDQDVPFQQAVMMSGGPGLNFNSHATLLASRMAAISQQVGCGSGESLETLGCIRDIPFERLTNLSVTASRAAHPPFASWVTNDGAWYALPTTATDNEVLGSFSSWLHKLSESTKEKLLNLYPLDDFKHMIESEHEGQVSPQYYRAAQMNRDIWFTCPVLDFTWQYTPVFDTMVVSMWGVAHLSDIPYLFYNDHLRAGADNSDPQLALARNFSRTIIQFAYGTPQGADNRLESWLPAFPNKSPESSTSDMPGIVTVQLFGGPHGSKCTTSSEDFALPVNAFFNLTLRSLFARVDDKLVQVVLDDNTIPFTEHADTSNQDPILAARDLCAIDPKAAFPLGLPPLWFTLVSGPISQNVLIIRLSHAQYDDICQHTIVPDLCLSYRDAKETVVSTDFAPFSRSLDREQTSEGLAYWRYLLGESTITNLPRKTPQAVSEDVILRCSSKVVIQNAPDEITMASVIKAALANVLRQATGDRTILFAQMVNFRGIDVPGIYRTFGPSFNRVPVCLEFAQLKTVLDLLQAIQDQHTGGIPFETIEWDHIVSNSTSWPLGARPQSLVIHQDVPVDVNLRMRSDLRCQIADYVPIEPTDDSIELYSEASDNSVELTLVSSSHFIRKGEMEILLERLCESLNTFTANPDHLLDI
ncbi:uncharacterized protein N7484_010301 [Penicillium longicatenatum]|uniref:uncharacterized protein n=1 Tax=Penicillium longicatenatum TaxID=1561947 RepID=UPI0025486BAD|nr:uncharacterized protein N7484_010301 [Penicillium longicatenatum]KAJ5630201.1 hypothetical protein N7484_010301 [Penicillium longicatenatum]